MGYDMYVEQEDLTRPDIQVMDDAAWEVLKRWYAGVQERDGYYRLNIWGMSSMRELLEAGGCLNWDATVDYDDPDATEHDTRGVLPGYKVSDNSGWHVSPTECMNTALRWFEGGGRAEAENTAAGIAEKWTEEGEPIDSDKVLAWGDNFVRWIGMAAGRGGFRVH